MPDSKKSAIVIASVLKPVDDSRMYEKIGISLASVDQYEVHVIGCASDSPVHPSIQRHPFKPFARISIRRLFAPWRIFFSALRLKPDLFIITTHELLFPALFVKLFRRSRVIYDVQENYYWNILYTSAFPLLARPFVALYVRAKETMTARYMDHFFLAERGYEHELKFPGDKKTVLENKARIPPSQRKAPGSFEPRSVIRLIFSGTLAESTGVFTAIDLAVKLHNLDDRFRLTIIGSSARASVLDKIRRLIEPRPFVELIAQESPIAHSRILEHIRNADFGLICYEINPSTMNSIPTKLYEYLGFRLPILLVNHKPWVDFCHPFSAAVVFDSAHIDAGRIAREMMKNAFYTAEPSPVYWETEEPKLMGVAGAMVGDG